MPDRVDLYPSRVGGEARILERKDPVVHGTGHGPLGDDQLRRFERDGFLFLESLIPAERVRALQEELTRIAETRRTERSPEIVREPESEVIRSIFWVHRTSPVFARLARDRRIVAIAEQLLGSPVYVHQSRVNRKPGLDGREFFWHSDFETWHVEDGLPRMRTVSVSISLTENNEYNGPLLLIPGSHRYFLSCAGTTPSEHYLASLRKQEYGVPDPESLAWLVDRGGIQSAKGPPGSVTVFECNMMHGSGGNLSPYPRSNIFLVYNSVENLPEEPFCGLPPRPEHIRGTDFRPVAAE